MIHHIKIRKVDGTWVVRAGGAVLAETTNALELTEGEMAPVIYFPKSDIAMAFLEPSAETTHSPYLGDAHYYSIETKSRSLTKAAWSFQDPAEGMGRIKDHIAFYTGNADVAIERL